MSVLRVGYLNVNSLPNCKFIQMLGLLGTEFDFLIVAEHWYEKHLLRLANPAVVGTSVLPVGYAKKHEKGRKGGGIYVLASDFWRSRVLEVKGDQYSVFIRVQGFSFIGVYFPPATLSCAAMQLILNGFPLVDIVLGDINTRFEGDRQQGVGANRYVIIFLTSGFPPPCPPSFTTTSPILIFFRSYTLFSSIPLLFPHLLSPFTFITTYHIGLFTTYPYSCFTTLPFHHNALWHLYLIFFTTYTLIFFTTSPSPFFHHFSPTLFHHISDFTFSPHTTIFFTLLTKTG